MNKWKHFKTVCTHKKNVFKMCRKTGITWQGITHDLSKFSPVEFNESAKYYCGDRSPINACKEANGYSLAWFHHRGRNKHHWQYWVDQIDTESNVVTAMPYKYALEMFCDCIGASMTYLGKDFTYQKEYEWWTENNSKFFMHPITRAFIDILMRDCANKGDHILKPSTCKEIHNIMIDLYERDKLDNYREVFI